jgi:hypothetical protein
MSSCNNHWCERYAKSKGNCDQCLENNKNKEKSDLNVILKRRSTEQMNLDKVSKDKGQSR